MNFFTGLPLGGSSVNPLTEDIVPDTDNVYDVGTSTKRLKTGYYTRLNVTDVGVQNTSLAYTGTLLPGSSFAADQSAGFAFTLDREITITRIMIDRNMNPTLPTPRGVRIWQEPGTLLFSGTVDNTVSDANYWYAEVNWVLNANVPLRYATDVPAFAEINYAPIAFTFSPFFTLVNPSVVALSLGVYPANQGLFPFPPIGNFLFRDGPAPITVNGIPVALLTDLAVVTALEAKTQNITATPGNTVFAGTTTGLNHVNLSNIGTKSHTQIDNDINDIKTATQNITGNPGVTTFTGTTVGLNHANLSNIGTNTHTQLDSHVADASIHFTQAAIDHVNILNKGTNTHAQIDAKLQNQIAVAPNVTTFLGKVRLDSAPNSYILDSTSTNFTIFSELKGDDIVVWDKTTGNFRTPTVRGLYIGTGNRPVCSGGFVATAASASVVNSAIETSITPTTGVGTLTLPANAIVAGSCTKISIGGGLGNDANTLINFRLYGGPTSTQLLGSFLNIPITPANGAGLGWWLDILFNVRTAGVAGTTSFLAKLNIGQQTYARVTNVNTINTTGINVFLLTVQWGAASANNTIAASQMITTNLFQPLA